MGAADRVIRASHIYRPGIHARAISGWTIRAMAAGTPIASARGATIVHAPATQSMATADYAADVAACVVDAA